MKMRCEGFAFLALAEPFINFWTVAIDTFEITSAKRIPSSYGFPIYFIHPTFCHFFKNKRKEGFTSFLDFRCTIDLPLSYFMQGSYFMQVLDRCMSLKRFLYIGIVPNPIINLFSNKCGNTIFSRIIDMPLCPILMVFF